MLFANPGLESNKYKKFLETNLLILTGYILVSAETFIARFIGLTNISYINIFLIGATVVSCSIFFILYLYYRKSINPFGERVIFFSQLILYFIMYGIWVYFIYDFRVFALFCSILAMSTVLLYTNIIQALLLSAGTVISYVIATYYSVFVKGRDGNFLNDIFFALCFIPTSILISVIANQITKKNLELEKSKEYLEDTNNQLLLLNRELKKAQKTSKIEIELAHDIQKSLFPEQPINTNGWDVALSFKPRQGVSGDFYDFYYEKGALTGLSLFDVSGHGVASALITILAKPVFSRYFNLFKNEPLGRVIEIANNTLRHDLSEVNMYITGILVRLRDENVEYVNAGHPDLLYKSKASARVNIISDMGLYHKFHPIGFSDISTCKSTKFAPQRGDIMLLYTDCITESDNMERNRYGSERLIQSLEEAPEGTAQEILDFLLERFYSFLDAKEIEDDCTMILVKKV